MHKTFAIMVRRPFLEGNSTVAQAAVGGRWSTGAPGGSGIRDRVARISGPAASAAGPSGSGGGAVRRQYQMFTTYSSRMIDVFGFAVNMSVWAEMLFTRSQAITQLAPHTRLAMSVV